MQASQPPSTGLVPDDERAAGRRGPPRNGEGNGHGRLSRTFYDDEAIGVVREHLIIQLGADAARGLLTGWGYELGRRDAQGLGRPFSWENDAQLLLAGPRLGKWLEQGTARMETRNVALHRFGSVDLEVLWYGCPEAQQYVAHLGRADHAVCWSLVGYYAGYSSTLLGREVVAVETTCAGMGADCCTIRLRGRDSEVGRGHHGLLQPGHAMRAMQGELERLRFESSMRLNRLEALREAVLDVTSDLDLEGVQAKIVSRGRVLLGARYGFLVMFTEASQGMCAGGPLPTCAPRGYVIIHDGLSPQDAAELEPFPIHTGLFSAVLQGGATLRVRRISEDPRSRGMPERHHALMSSFLGVPVRIHGQLCGALYFTDRLDGSEFSLDDEKLAESFAAHAGVALENARLVETIASERSELMHSLEREQDFTSELHQVREELERDRELLRALVDLPEFPDIDSALSRVLSILVTLLQADVGTILLCLTPNGDGDGDEGAHLEVRAFLEQGRPVEVYPEDRTLPPGVGLSGRVARSHEVVYVRDVVEDRSALEPHLRERGVRSLLGAPLTVEGRLIGVVHVGSYAVRTFDPPELGFLRAAANTTALSLERARLHQEVRRSDQLLRAVLEAAPIGLAVTVPPSGATLLSNGVMRRLEDIGRAAGVHPAGDAPQRALAGETVRRFEQDLRHPLTGANVSVRASAAPVRGEGESVQAAVTVVEELTLEKEIERLREQFVSLVAHDLRNPLNAAMLHLELLRERLEAARRGAAAEGDLVAESLGSAEAISRSMERVSDLVDDLFDYSRLQAGQLAIHRSDVPLRPLVGALLDELRPLLGGRTPVIEIEEDLPPLRADQRRLAQVLTNLLSNAVKYTPNSARLGLRARRCDAVEASLLAPIGDERRDRPGAWVLVTVWDEGPGIPAEARPRLFDPFYRLSRDRERREGTGLGLYITRGLCEAHGGLIWIDDVPGASFSMLWPAAD